MAKETSNYSFGVNKNGTGTLVMDQSASSSGTSKKAAAAALARNRSQKGTFSHFQDDDEEDSALEESDPLLQVDDDISLFNYIRRSSPNSSCTDLSLDQVLTNKLEQFISSTLATMEEYFNKVDFTPVDSNGSQFSDITKYHPHQHLQSHDRLSNARLVYQSLTLLKSASRDRKFEILDKILDEYYGNIFQNYKMSSSDEKLILGLEFIEAKLKKFLNTKSEELLASSSDAEKRGLISQTFRDLNIQFHNYDNALICGKHRLLHYWELPFPWRENKFIVYGYRFNHSFKHCVKSVFEIHNETGNIWTHILGFCLVSYLAAIHLPNSAVFAAESTSISWIIYIYIFLLASMKSLVSSVCWHTFNSTSNLPVRSRFACIDYTGIAVLITASIVTTEYCSLYHYPKIRNIFIGFSTVLGALGFFFTWSPAFDTPKARPFRIFFFVSLAGFGALSAVTLGYMNGFVHALQYYIPLWKSIASYLTGVVFYGFLFPECCRSDVIVDEFDICDEILNELNDHDDLETHFKVPSKTEKHGYFSSLWWVDYACSSHNIWHFFVVCGIYFHYTAILEMLGNIDHNLPVA